MPRFLKLFQRFVALCCCLALLSAVLCGCGRKAHGKAVSWLLSDTPKNLDPQTAAAAGELMVIKNCFAGLFSKSQDGTLYSDTLREWSVSTDGLRYTFYLEPDRFWSAFQDGKLQKADSVTADDFAFALRRVFTDRPGAEVLRTLSCLKNADRVLAGEDVSLLGISCPDSKTLQLDLSRRCDTLTETLCDPCLFPCNEAFFKSTAGRYGLSAELLLYNGSFYLSGWGESSIKLKSNPYAAGNAGHPEAVTLYLPKKTRLAEELLANGAIDAALLSADQYDRLQNPGKYTVSKSSAILWALIFNPNDPLWQNADLRSALFYGADRSAGGEEAHLTQTRALVSDTAQLYGKNYRELQPAVVAPKYDRNTAQARCQSAFASLGLRELYKADILVPDRALIRDRFSALNQIYQRDLSLYFSPTVLSEQTLLSRVKSGDFSAALVPLSVLYDSPECILSYFDQSQPACLLPLTAPAYTDAMQEARRQSGNAAAAAAAYARAEQQLLSSALALPLFCENQYFVTSTRSTGFMRDFGGSVLFAAVR